MKSFVVMAALVAAFGISMPVAVEAKALSNLTDTQIYCSLFPYTVKCAAVKPSPVVKPAPKLAAAKKPAIRTLHCVRAAPKAGHLYECAWK